MGIEEDVEKKKNQRWYMHTATNSTTDSTTIANRKAKVMKVKLSRNFQADVELNQNELWLCRLLKGWQSNIKITAYVIKLDLSG